LRVDDVGAGLAILCRFRAPHAARVPTTTRLCF